MRWSLGFIFSTDLDQVVLLRKGKTLHVGFWNGIGGKLEGAERPQASMARECLEETGLRIAEELWDEVGMIGFPDGNRVDVFGTWVPNITSRLPIADSPLAAWPDDKPVVVPVSKIDDLRMAPHAEILIYAATQILRDPSRAPVVIQEVARF